MPIIQTATLEKLLSANGLTEEYPFNIQQGKDGAINFELLAPDIVAVWPSVKAQDNLAVIVSCGIHGDETAPIEIVANLLDDIRSKRQSIRRPTLFIFGNRTAMVAERRYVDFDLNRLFGNSARNLNFLETGRAVEIEGAINGFIQRTASHLAKKIKLLCIDLHTAIRGSYYKQFGIAAYPAQNVSKWLKACKLNAIVLDDGRGHTFTGYCTRLVHDKLDSVMAFTCELGRVAKFGMNDLPCYASVNHVARLACEGGEPEDVKNVPPAYRVYKEIIKSSEKFVLNVPADIVNFSLLPKGMVLAEDGEYQEIITQENCYLLFPKQHVEVGLRAAILLIPYDDF